MVVRGERRADPGQRARDQAHGRAVVHQQHIAGVGLRIEETLPQVLDHGQEPVQHVRAGFAAGHRHLQIAFVPGPVDALEGTVRLFVVEALQVTGLHLVHTLEHRRGHSGRGLDETRGLPGSQRLRGEQHPRRRQQRRAERLRLRRTAFGQRQAGHPGVQQLGHVALGLAVPDQDQPARAPPPRPRVVACRSRRSRATSRGTGCARSGAAPSMPRRPRRRRCGRRNPDRTDRCPDPFGSAAIRCG
ncbi:Uncharacterised protein [Mycobacteroides abscessus subsp. abscessus]|nr:Uncharacterised protein [Mycobacteroides abscessus subsp. abscessus]